MLPEVRKALERLGHEIRVVNGWTATFGGVQMIFVELESPTLTVASDPRREAYGLAHRGGRGRPSSSFNP